MTIRTQKLIEFFFSVAPVRMFCIQVIREHKSGFLVNKVACSWHTHSSTLPTYHPGYIVTLRSYKYGWMLGAFRRLAKVMQDRHWMTSHKV